jgi:hypothetical protein
MPKEIVKELKVVGWPIVLEKTELLEAQKHFGGTVGSRGDASEALGWLCLYHQDANASWILWLESSEIDGPTIGGFQWQVLPRNAKVDRRCQSTNGKQSGVELPGSLRLGMTETEVTNLLGAPSAHLRDKVIYCHEHNLTIDSEPYTLFNDVVVTYRKGTVSAIAVTHTTSS